MKKLMIAAAGRRIAGGALIFAASTASGQFAGKLVYQIVRPSVVVTMTYYQSGNSVHVEAYTIDVTKGKLDSSTFFPQDTILFDLTKGTETHLQRHTGRAIITQYTATIMAEAGYGKGISSASVQLVGPDTANGYSCTHFVENYGGAKPFGASRRDIWVTNALGNPGIMVMGSFLYYTPGAQRLQALNTAGCAGVVVRTKMSGMGQTTVMNLIAVDTKRLNARMFQIPSYYSVIDNSGYVPPKAVTKP
ncbi:MAG TPA: DUF4412 domain-containing protein [Puia sp.]|jgi:hypothetical protein|nr:DUF4412 domain-containing protein [Puia sp.]